MAGCKTPIDADSRLPVTLSAAQPTTRPAAARHFDRVLIIVLENQDEEKAIRDPYLAALASRGANFTQFQGLAHPSYPNYLAMVSGKLPARLSDQQVDLSDPTIADSLADKGLTWKNYAEGYPGHGFAGSSAPNLFARKHVPFLSYPRARATQNVVDEQQFAKDVQSQTGADIHPADERFPNYAFYSPNLIHDGHDSGLRGGSQWLKGFLEPLLANNGFMRRTLVVVTFDESGHVGFGDTNHIYTVFLGPGVQPGQYGERYNHYNVLRTIEDNFGLGTLAEGDGRAKPIVGIWKELPPG